MPTRRIREKCSKILSQCRVGYYRLMGTTIGKKCYISSGAHIDVRRGKITIGDKVSISHGSYILGHTGKQPLAPGQETKLENNVKVFVNAVVCPGVTVGENSIVGAGCVVVRDIPPNVVVMGNPGRVVKYLEDKENLNSS